MFLEFDISISHSVRDTFLSTGNEAAYRVRNSLPPTTSTNVTILYACNDMYVCVFRVVVTLLSIRVCLVLHFCAERLA